MSVIKFGTDGWRAKMGDEFSFKNVRVFIQAYSNYLKRKHKNKDLSVVVDYDTRFLSEEFAVEAAKMFSLNGIKAIMPLRDAPLGAVSLFVTRYKCSGAIIFTASFHKPIYNGIKVFTHKGIPALPEETDEIEKEVETVLRDFHFKPYYPDDDLITYMDFKSHYVEYLEELVDFKLIRESNLKIVVDNLYGTSRDYLDYILNENDIEMVSIHNFPYSSFGGVISSWVSDNLKDLSKLVVQQHSDIGLATDIDGDRFAIVDSSGRYLPSNIIMPPLIEYLIKVRDMEGGIVKSITTTRNIKKVADYYLRKVYTTPVGFKYLADAMYSRRVFIAVESSNGASLHGRVRVKDGILFSLLVTEMLAWYKQEMKKILNDFYQRFPRLYSRDVTVKLDDEMEEKYYKLLKKKSFDFSAYSLDLEDCDYTDGIKFEFDDSWLLIRKSGTKPVIRIYSEAQGLKQAQNLIKVGRSLID
jgi:phosphoglucomutase